MTEHHMKPTDVALRQEHKTCEVMQAVLAERGDEQISDERMKKALEGEGGHQ